MPYSNKDGLENIPPTYIYGKNTIFWFRNFIFSFFHNKIPSPFDEGITVSERLFVEIFPLVE